MLDRGLFLTLQAIRRQLAAMPYDLYSLRLIHAHTHRPFPGERVWTAEQLFQPATIRFLRVRNRDGFDIYIRPDAWDQNAGYILVDLDDADAHVLDRMRRHGHHPVWSFKPVPGICKLGSESRPLGWNPALPP
jgi:hypothetical protein